MMSLAAAGMAILAITACGPSVDAQTPKVDGTELNGTSQEPSNPLESAAPPPVSETECHIRASQSVPQPTEPTASVQEQFDAFFLKEHETFRCCFDALYAPKMPHTNGELTLYVMVSPVGKLVHDEIIASETTPQGGEVDACILKVSRALAYPVPVTNGTVGYKRTFHFMARR
jgi:hypothetical protein